tara:strand:+ start:104 stop:379 length:276 start_codon:yes stop_codon:yes gene_type:complete
MANEDQVRQQQEALQCYRNIFLHTPDGRTVLNDLIKTSGLFQINGVRENDELQHRTGSQDMVRRIISILGLDEEQILSMTLNLEEGDYDDD